MAADWAQMIFNKKFSYQWVYDFTQHHSDYLTSAVPQAVSARRVSPSVLPLCLNWIQQFANWLAGLPPIPAKCYLNIDETRLVAYRKEKDAKKIVARKVAKKTELKRGQYYLGSMIVVCSAAGEVLHTAICIRNDTDSLAHHYVPKPTRGLRSAFDEPAMYYTKSGSFNSEIYADVIRHLAEKLEIAHPGLQHVLLMDNATIHTTAGVKKAIKETGIHGYLLPANTTHFLQPLDRVPFAVFKAHLRKIFK